MINRAGQVWRAQRKDELVQPFVVVSSAVLDAEDIVHKVLILDSHHTVAPRFADWYERIDRPHEHMYQGYQRIA